MSRRYPGLRFVGPVALTSLCSFAVCTLVAVVLYRQQWTITEELGENVGSRRAASDLEENLRFLLSLLHKQELSAEIGRAHV